MSFPTTPYADRQRLLTQLRSQDNAFDWAAVFATAQSETDQQLVQSESQGEVMSIQRVQRGMSLIKNAVTGLVIMGTGLFVKSVVIGSLLPAAGKATPAQRSMEHLISSLSSFLIGLGAAAALLMLTLGAVMFLFAGSTSPVAERERQIVDKVLDHSPLSADVKVVVPAPITYHLSSALGPLGEVLAYISRRSPVIRGGEVHVETHTVGAVTLGEDEGGAEFAERFEQLLDDVAALERHADSAYQSLLLDKGLDESHLADTEADLRLAAEQAADRRVLNAGVVESLNREGNNHKAADPEIADIEQNLELDPGVRIDADTSATA